MRWTTEKRCTALAAARATGHCSHWWHVSTTHTKTNTSWRLPYVVTALPALVRTTDGEHSLPYLWLGVFLRKTGSRKITSWWTISNCVSDTVWPVIRKSVTMDLSHPTTRVSILSETITPLLWYLPLSPIRTSIGKKCARPTSVWTWACSIRVSASHWMLISRIRTICWWRLPSPSLRALKILPRLSPMPARCATKEWKWHCVPSTWKASSPGNPL